MVRELIQDETTDEVIESTTTASQEMSVDNTTASEVMAADATSLPEQEADYRKNGKEERQDYYFLHDFDGFYSYSFKTSFHHFLPG